MPDKVCSVSENGEPCGRSASDKGCALGMCSMHYRRFKRWGSAEVRYGNYIDEYTATPLKKCRVCSEVKLRTEFPRHAAGADGHRNQCSDCHNGTQRSRYGADPVRRKNMAAAQRRYLYGLSPADFDNLLFSQGGACGLCAGPPGPKGFCVDHCHSTGATRGIVCHRCNVALGLFKDDPAYLRSAIAYLEDPPMKRLNS